MDHNDVVLVPLDGVPEFVVIPTAPLTGARDGVVVLVDVVDGREVPAEVFATLGELSIDISVGRRQPE